MAKQYTREEMKARVQAQIDAGSPIVITGAGTGISAKFAELGGADMIGIYNSGFFRMDGSVWTGKAPREDLCPMPTETICFCSSPTGYFLL